MTVQVLGPVGSAAGTAFQDELLTGGFVNGIVIFDGGTTIYGFELYYHVTTGPQSGDQYITRGIPGGLSHQYTFSEGEVITGISGTYLQTITSLSYTTSKLSSPTYGQPQGTSFSLAVSANQVFLGFAGREDSGGLNALGLVVADSERSGLPIGGVYSTVISTGHVLYALTATQVMQYQGSPNQWVAVGGPMVMLAAGELKLYGLDTAGVVWEFQGVPNQWLQIGAGKTQLAAGGSRLCATDSTSNALCVYEGIPMGWTEIGPAPNGIAQNDIFLFVLSNSQQVLQYTENPPAWKVIGGPARQLFAAENALYQVDVNSDLLRWEGHSNLWTRVGQGWVSFASAGPRLFALSQDGSTVGEFDGTAGTWTSFAGAATTICADHKNVYILDASGVSQWALGSGSESAIPETLAAAADTNENFWYWTFQTSNRWFSGFSGKVWLSVILSNNYRYNNIPLPFTSFRRGRSYTFRLKMGDIEIDSIHLETSDSWFHNHWTVDWLTAFNPAGSVSYRFDINGDIPEVFARPSRNSYFTGTKAATHTASGVATVFVWDYLGKEVAWGHASIELDDGTYISWWPVEENRESMPLLPMVYSANAFLPRAFSDDIVDERNAQPAWRIAVGGLNQASIKVWWADFQTKNRWSTLTQNCSTTVADALWAGGARDLLTTRQCDNFELIHPWTPNDVLGFATAIAQKGTAATDMSAVVATDNGSPKGAEMALTATVYLPLDSVIQVQACTNSSSTEQITITPEVGEPTVLIGTGQNVPITNGYFPLVTPSTSQSPLGFSVVVAIAASANPAGPYLPSKVKSGSSSIHNFSVSLVASESPSGSPPDFAAVQFSWWTQPVVQSSGS